MSYPTTGDTGRTVANPTQTEPVDSFAAGTDIEARCKARSGTIDCSGRMLVILKAA